MTIKISKEVKAAQASKKAVVALESTLITHGFPAPDNLAIAREAEACVREGGATPATIAIIDGDIRVGLSDQEIEYLASRPVGIQKASSRDLAFCLSQGLSAGMTVAATMRIAAMAGVRIFATGGIGGVHRGVEGSFDISADLTELSRTPVVVVSAGAKSLLDLSKTLEYLETACVPVIGYGTNEFPAFYCRSSGLHLDTRVDTPKAAAAIIAAHYTDLKSSGGMLMTNPLSTEQALDLDEMNAHIETALIEANKQGIVGKAMTPFLLDHLLRATSGRTMEPNKALIRANAKLAADIACALSVKELSS